MVEIRPDITSETTTGACLCGAVRFTIVLPVLWCAHCHCSMCRRAHGAPYVTWVGVARVNLTVTDGAGELTAYQSSDAARRSFCRTCGSMLFFEAQRWPDQVHIARASIPSAKIMAPRAHVFFDDRADWVSVDDHLPRLGGKDGTTPLPKGVSGAP